jgi:hypothetical protein
MSQPQGRRTEQARDRPREPANQKAVDDCSRQVAAANRKADAHNKRVIDDLNRRLQQQGATAVRYTEQERRLAERVHDAVAHLDPWEHDTFLSYARRIRPAGEVGTNVKTRREVPAHQCSLRSCRCAPPYWSPRAKPRRRVPGRNKGLSRGAVDAWAREADRGCHRPRSDR